MAALVLSRRGGAPPLIRIGTLVLALAVAGIMTVTAERGGRINHPEAHDGAAPDEGEDAGEGGRGRGRGRGGRR